MASAGPGHCPHPHESYVVSGIARGLRGRLASFGVFHY